MSKRLNDKENVEKYLFSYQAIVNELKMDESFKDSEAALYLLVLLPETVRYSKLRTFLKGDCEVLTKKILHYYTLKKMGSIREEENTNKNSTASVGNRSQA